MPGGLTPVVVTAFVGTEALSKGLSQPLFHVVFKELPGPRAGGVSLTLPNKSSKASDLSKATDSYQAKAELRDSN